MLAQAEGEPEFRDVGEGESPNSNSGLAIASVLFPLISGQKQFS